MLALFHVFPTSQLGVSDINMVLDIVGKAHLVDLLAATAGPDNLSRSRLVYMRHSDL